MCGMWWDSSQCVGNMMGFITVCVECGGIHYSEWGIWWTYESDWGLWCNGGLPLIAVP